MFQHSECGRRRLTSGIIQISFPNVFKIKLLHQIKHALQPPSSKVLIAVSKAIYIYFGSLTIATIIGYYTVLQVQSSDG